MNISPINTGRTEGFRFNESVNVGIGAAAIIWQYTVPSKCRLRFKSFGNYLGTVAAWGVAYWQMGANGVPVKLGDQYAVFDQIGYAAQRQIVTEDEYGGATTLIIMGVNPTAAILAMGVSIEFDLIYQE